MVVWLIAYPLGSEFPGQFARALARPPQAAHRVAALRRFDQPIECRQQGWIVGRHPLASAASLTDRACREGRGGEILQAAGDAGARHAGRFVYSRNAAMPQSLRLRGTPQPAQPFIQMGGEKERGLLHRYQCRVHAGTVSQSFL